MSERFGDSVQCADKSRNYFRKYLIFSARQRLTAVNVIVTKGIVIIPPMVGIEGGVYHSIREITFLISTISFDCNS